MLAGAIVGQPASDCNGAMGLFSAVSGFGKKPETSPEQQALGMILEELHAIRQQMKECHEEEMAALRDISSKLDHLDIVNRQFRELALEIALVRTEVRELLSDDVRRCDLLADGFMTLQVTPNDPSAFVVFGSWFAGSNHDPTSDLVGPSMTRPRSHMALPAPTLRRQMMCFST